MTYEEMRNFALEHYNEGGDGFYECYEDYQIKEWLEMEGLINASADKIKSALLRSFGVFNAVREDIQGA